MADKVVSVTLRARVEGFTAGMRSARKSVDDLTKADVPKAAKGYSDLANKAALAGAAIAVGLGAAVKRFADFDKAMSAVRANTGATGAELESLRAAAIKLGADSQFSAKEAADGVNELAKAGVKSADILGGGLKGSLDLAAAGQIGVADAAETTASALTQFGLSGSDAVHVADLLASGANKAQGGVGDLGAALGQAGLVAAATGLSIEETAAGLTAFASAGLIGSDAGTSFKTMLQRLSAPSGEAKTLMDQLGISAYDSQGNFVGLAEVAGQLKTGMEDLTPAQRNAAQATIFGSDAVRASNILYEQGAEGIRKWTTEVDDQGAAARQAAQLTDNFSGDLERLGGAFDSVLIQTGSGANDALRGLVQGLQGLVEVVGKIPGPMLLAGAGLTALALGVPKGITTFRSFAATMDSVGLSFDKISARGPKAAKGMNIAAGAAKGLGAAFVALEAIAIASRLGDDSGSLGVEGLTRDLSDGGDAVAAFSAKIKHLQDTSQDLTNQDVTSFGDAIRYTFSPDTFANVDHAIQSFGAAFGIVDSSAVTRSAARLTELDQALAGLVASGHGDEAARMFDQFAAAAGLQGVSADQLMGKLTGYGESLAGVDNAEQSATGSVEAFTTATEDAQTSVDDFAAALRGLNQPNLDLRDAQRAVQEAMQGTKDVVGEVRDKLIAKAIADGKSEESAKKWADAQLKAGEALNKNRTEFDITTESGRAYQESIDTLAGSYQTQIDKLAETGASQGTLDKTLRTSREELYKTAVRMGLSKEAARLYVDQVLKIPPAASTKVTADTTAATAAVDALQRRINGLHGKDVRINVRYNAGTLPNGGRDLTGGITKDAAAGGAIYGPGTGTSDSIPARLSNGEHVLTAAEVAKMGGQGAVYAMRRAIQGGWRPGFANGGAVQYAPPVHYMAGGPVSHSTTNTGMQAETVNFYNSDAKSFERKIMRATTYRAKARPGR